MAIKRELIQLTIENSTDCEFNIPLFQQNVFSINATTKYSYDITTEVISCGTGAIVINSVSFNLVYQPTLAGLLSALNALGFGFFCSETISGSTFIYVVDDTNIYGNLVLCDSGVTTTSTTTTTTVAPTTTTTTSTTTVAPTTTTTTSTTTVAPTTTTTTSTTTEAPTTTTTTSTTTEAPTTTTTTSTTTEAPTTTTTTSTTTEAPTTTTTTSTTTSVPTTTSTTTTTTTGAGGTILIENTTSGSSSIGGITPTWFILPIGFPITNGNSEAGTHSGNTGVFTIDIATADSPSIINIFVNGLLVDCINVTTAGNYNTASLTIAGGDFVLIRYQNGTC